MGNYIHLLCFQTAIDLQKHLETKAASLEKRGAKLQPHVVVLAIDNLREVDTAACYAVCARAKTTWYIAASTTRRRQSWLELIHASRPRS